MNIRPDRRQRKIAIAILKEARVLIAKPYGWVQHTGKLRRYRGEGFAYCSTVAIFEVQGRRSAQWAIDALRYAMSPDGSYKVSIVGFNDAAHTTKSMVLRRFDKAIRVLEAV